MNELKLTVRDVLARDSFKCAKVIAGESGLERQVKWSHVLEVNDFESLINGGEMILTTGGGLQLDLPKQLAYLKKLIEKDVACICIELGIYFKEIPSELIDLANKHSFPIVIFEHTVKFVDITQDLHTFIINQHHQMLSQLDVLSRKFNALSLTPNGILKILLELHQFFREDVIFITDNGKSYYYPTETKELEKTIRTYLENSMLPHSEQILITIDEQSFALMPVDGLGQTWGYLCLQLKQTIPDEFTFLMLDRAALAIAQILLRNRTIEERKQHNEDEIVRNLLNGRDVDRDDLQTYLPATSRNLYYRVFIIRTDFPESRFSEEDWEEIKLQRSMMIRSLFKRQGFFPAVSTSKSEIAVIASFIAADYLKMEKNRFSQIIQHIISMHDNNFLVGSYCSFGVSKVYKEVGDVKKSYEEASKALKMRVSGIGKTHFYEELGIYKLLLLLKNSNYLENYVQDYLSAILDYDEKMESNLFETLCVYLECSGSKKETAESLFIVRQTLYHRLEKLESLLGEDFMEPSNRLALEVAIMAFRLLKEDEEKTGLAH
ncbi:PucR family transcriptional regulator [Psychrobacillus lasiicapitis]|uniref:PucR family transcriptional regulator n=1 Tax=Psychrobacillus lasiicapitis TaxID=1636719 RepID=A0A544TGW7_9BACI|nr:PucR family transcriptional regulator [Psychrobacillus lasiicapitis]TQR16666.1 PucR family transcriptional regulator [Psychrobacillus lasiicapitis]GGA28241.1 transcriptional regulator [Psychrobacillus lasiicapitis]